jgi:hypothetical protein
MIKEVKLRGYYFNPEQLDIIREQLSSKFPKPVLEVENILSEREIDVLKRKGYKIMLVGDFNAHVCDRKNMEEGVVGRDFNGECMSQLCGENNLCVKNFDEFTKGVWTWGRGDKCSVIDYILVGEEYSSNVENVIVDEEGIFDMNSDHNVITWEFKDSGSSEGGSNKSNVNNKRKNNGKVRWNLESAKWDDFQRLLGEEIKIWEDKYCTNEITEDVEIGTVEDITSEWIQIIHGVAKKTIGELRNNGKGRKKVKLQKHTSYVWIIEGWQGGRKKEEREIKCLKVRCESLEERQKSQLTMLRNKRRMNGKKKEINLCKI